MGTELMIVCAAGKTPPEIRQLEAHASKVHLVSDRESWEQACATAKVAFMWDYQSTLPAEMGGRGLEWLHVNSIGVDALREGRPWVNNPVITNTRGIFEPPLAEFVLASLLYFTKDLRGNVERQRRAEWRKVTTENLRHRHALVLGAGGVGRAIVELLRAAGMRVTVAARTARADQDGIGLVHSVAEIDRLLAEADDVILAMPLTDETARIIDASRLACMKPRARLINVGRGGLVDEEALIQALEAGHIGGAALDVFVQEPLPANHPFWGMENVLVSPHMSGDVEGWQAASISLFASNLLRWEAGEPLQNVVSPSPFAQT